MRQLRDRIAFYLITGAAWTTVALLIGIFVMLLYKGVQMFGEVTPGNFFLSSDWNPGNENQPSYGILSLLWSTALVTLGAMVLAVPVGLATAAFISELAPTRLRNILKPAVELLAGIPSVVVGFIGIEVVGPFLQQYFGLSTGFNALNGAILLCVMSLPTIISLSEDAIRSVPNAYKEASYALGATGWVTLIKVTLPACTSGIISACVLGMGRAIGETMTVLMVTGNAAAMPKGFFDSVRTLTATIAIELGEVAYGTTHYFSLFAIGSVLFIICLIFNVLAEWIAAGYRVKQQL